MRSTRHAAAQPLPLRRAAILAACLLLAAGLLAPALLATALLAQDEPGAAARLSGRVTDLPGTPIAGVVVTLSPIGGGEEGSTFTATTDRRGRWGVLGPWPGRWRIVVEATGFIPGEGHVDVPAVGSPAPVDVGLRSLDEVPPAFSESPGTALRWIEAGSALLAQGRTAEARVQLEKAVPLVAPGDRPEILRSVARTHFLEGDVETTVATLEEALRLAPDDDETRKLYRALAAELDRLAEAEAFLGTLAELEPGGREEAAPASTGQPAFTMPPEVVRWLEADPVPLAAELRGHHAVRLADTSPVGDLGTFLERSGWTEKQVRQYDSDPSRDLAEESFHLFVPDREPPEAGWGVIVWVAPVPWGGFSRQEIEEVLTRRGIVWIGANRAGNPRPVWKRQGLALDAAESVARHFPVDRSRLWVAGYSGGGRVASALASQYPEAFAGAFCFFGVNHFHPVPVPDKPGKLWPVGFPEPPRERLATIRADRSFVLLTGERDFNRAETWGTYRHLLADGFERVEIVDLPMADHYYGLQAGALERGLAFLDRR